MSVLTPTDVRSYLKLTAAEHPDAEVQPFIDAAEQAIVNKCGPLVATATTSRVRGNGVEKLNLPVSPVRSLTSVTPVGGTALTVADLYASPVGVVEYLNGGSFTARWYDVAYSTGHGANAGGVPADLMKAVKELVRHLWDTQRRTSRGRNQSEAYSNTLPGAAHVLVFRVMELLTPYLQPGFA